MEKSYVSLSLEIHLFFCRIMKEHSLFLMASFPEKYIAYTKKANYFRVQFEELLCETVKLSNGRIGEDVLQSGEVVTDYTLKAEQQTSFLTGIEINSKITMAEKELCSRDATSVCDISGLEEMMRMVRQLNRKALCLLDGLIGFKENIIREVTECRLFTFIYPLMVKHILHEAQFYRLLVMNLEKSGNSMEQDTWNTEMFWNNIMKEHALFIRGLLDPSEETLIDTADCFAKEYKELLEEMQQECMMAEVLTRKSLEETIRFKDFNVSGTKGVTECQIAGLILPLMADHDLRETNHYLRLLKNACNQWKDDEVELCRYSGC